MKKEQREKLVTLGELFTEEFINNSKNEKIKNFKTSAEVCREKIIFRRKVIILSGFMILLGLISIFAGVYTERPFFFVPAVVSIIVGALYGFDRLSTLYSQVGSTHCIVYKNWKRVRKDIIKFNIHRTCKMPPLIHKKEDDCEEVRPIYIELERLAEDVVRFETDGLERRRQKARGEMLTLTDLAGSLGFDASDWGEFFNPGNRYIKRKSA